MDWPRVLGQVHHPEVEPAITHVVEVAQASGVAPGFLIASPKPGEIARCIDEGFRFISVGLDTLMLVDAARDLVGQWRQPAGC